MFSLGALQGRSKVTFSLEGSESIVVSEAHQVIEESSNSGISDQLSHSVCGCVCMWVCMCTGGGGVAEWSCFPVFSIVGSYLHGIFCG